MQDVSTKFTGMSCANLTVVLGTAIVHARDSIGVLYRERVLPDSGSQISAITNNYALRFGLIQRRCPTKIVGLGQHPVIKAKGVTSCTLQPHFESDHVFE